MGDQLMTGTLVAYRDNHDRRSTGWLLDGVAVSRNGRRYRALLHQPPSAGLTAPHGRRLASA